MNGNAAWRMWIVGLLAGLAAAAGGASSVAAAEFARTPVPAWVSAVEPGIDEAGRTQAVNGRHYRLVDNQVLVRAGERVRYRRTVVEAIHAGGVESVANIEIGFDPSYQTLELHAIAVTRDGQTSQRLERAEVRILQREAELERRIFDGRKTAHIFLDDIRIGDVIDYAYSVRGRNPVFGDAEAGSFSLQFDEPVARIHARLATDASIDLQLLGPPSAVETVHGRSDALAWRRWQVDQVPALVFEKGTPGRIDPYPRVSWTSDRDWGEVARWAVPLYAHAPLPGGAVEAEIARIAAASDSPVERLLAALRFSQSEIRYLGIEIGAGSHAPTPPDRVLERRFGDCKDKTLLLVVMLEGLGIEARPALVATGTRRGLQERLPSPIEFNHVVVRVELDGQTWWLDPTRNAQLSRLDTLAQADFGVALVVDPATTGLESMASSRPRPRDRDIVLHWDARSGFDQPVSFVVVTDYRAALAESMRSNVANNTREKLTRDYLDYYARYYHGIRSKGTLEIEDDIAENRLRTTERYEISGFGTDGADGRRTGTIWVPDLDSLVSSPGPASRVAPLGVEHPLEVGLRTEVLLSDDWSFEPETVTVEDPAFRWERTVEPHKDRLVITDHFRSRVDEVPAAEAERYIGNLARVRGESGFPLAWPAAGSADAGQDAINWTLVLVALMALVLWSLAAQRLYRWDPAPARPLDPGAPTGMAGWLVLPLIGAWLNPLLMLYSLYSLREIWLVRVWHAMTGPGGAAYHPHMGPFMLYSVIVVAGLLVLSILLLVQFMRRRSSAPRLYIALLLGVAGTELLDVGLGSMVGIELERDEINGVFRGCFSALIWTAYFLRSRRVANTFRRRIRGALEPPVPATGAIPVLAD